MSGLEMKYFVLKPRGLDAYAKASREALLTYAHLIYTTNPELSKDLQDWYCREKLVAEGGFYDRASERHDV